jgi:hypothetical protein
VIKIKVLSFDSGPVRKEINITSSSDFLIRRIFLDIAGATIADVTYEYDKYHRCTSGVVLDQFHNLLGTYEHIYDQEKSIPRVSIERDLAGNILNRKSYAFSPDGKPASVEFFDREQKVGYGKLSYDKDGGHVDTECYDNLGHRVDSFNLSRILNF